MLSVAEVNRFTDPPSFTFSNYLQVDFAVPEESVQLACMWPPLNLEGSRTDVDQMERALSHVDGNASRKLSVGRVANKYLTEPPGLLRTATQHVRALPLALLTQPLRGLLLYKACLLRRPRLRALVEGIVGLRRVPESEWHTCTWPCSFACSCAMCLTCTCAACLPAAMSWRCSSAGHLTPFLRSSTLSSQLAASGDAAHSTS